MENENWKLMCERKGRFDYYPRDSKEFMDLYRGKLRVASVNETMGPNWKPIVWIAYLNGNKSPMVFK